MIYSVSGVLTDVEQNLAVVECGGVGYACRTTSYTLSKLKIGSEVKLYTVLKISEDAADLFGFADRSELECFKLLTSVSGVGAKGALSILSQMDPQQFALCIASEDSKALTRAPGIGKKTADLIVLKLKDKIQRQAQDIAAQDIGVGAVSNNFAEAITALQTLGYSSSEAAKAISGMPQDTPSSELIKAGLKNLSKF